MLWDRVDVDVDGCIESALYDKQEMKTVTVLWPWTDAPYADLQIYPEDEELSFLPQE